MVAWLRSQYKGTFIVVKTALAIILAPDAAVINVTTGIATLPYVPMYSSYATSEIASIKLFDDLQHEHSTRHFVSVHPDVVETAMDEKIVASGTVLPKDENKWQTFSRSSEFMLMA